MPSRPARHRRGTGRRRHEADLANRIGLSPRHLRRLFHQHLGVTPDQFARSRRAHFARRLLDDTDLAIAQIAFASGFSSLRQFNRAMHEIFRESPRQLRARRRRTDRLVADGGLRLRLQVAAGFDWNDTLTALAQTAIPWVEEIHDTTYRRTISLDGAPGLLEILPGGSDHVILRAHLPYWEGLIHIVDRVAGLLGVAACGDEPTPTTSSTTSPPVREWLPMLANLLGAKPPRHVPRWLARLVAGEAAVAMATQSRGASNAKAKRELGWTLRYPSWRQGFVAAYASTSPTAQAAP